MDLFGDNMGDVPKAIEMTLMTKRATNAVQIPPVTSHMGHKAEDWRGKQMWTGHTKVMMEGSSICKIQMVNEDGTVFAQTQIQSDNYDQFV